MADNETIQIIIREPILKTKFIKAKSMLMKNVDSDLTQVQTLDLLLDSFLED